MGRAARPNRPDVARKVTEDSFEVKKEDAHPFCAYELTVTEGGKSTR